MKRVLDCCNKPHEGQGWALGNYHGFSGSFCHDCYDLISHDPYGKPRDPEGYLLMCIKLGVTPEKSEK